MESLELYLIPWLIANTAGLVILFTAFFILQKDELNYIWEGRHRPAGNKQMSTS